MADDPPELRVGVVGLGFGERVHVPGWRLVPGATVATVCARHGAHAAAERLGVPQWTDDWRSVVADGAIDVVSVATPPSTHYEIALAALRAGKGVLCEKPLTVQLAHAEELSRAAASPAVVNFSYRALPQFRLARKRLADGSLGALRDIAVRWHVSSRLDATQWSWRDSVDEGGGALAAYCVHALDYVEWIGGHADALSASFTLGRAERAGRPVTSDDACALQLVLASGARATIDVSLVEPEPVHRVEVRCANGTLVLENRDRHDPVGPFTVSVDGATVFGPAAARTTDDPRVAPFAVLAAKLADAVRGGSHARPSFEDGLRAQTLLDAARRSGALHGRSVGVGAARASS